MAQKEERIEFDRQKEELIKKIQEIDQYAIGEVTENKRDTIVGMGKGEYLPVKSNENRKYLRTREDTIYIIEGVRNS